MQHLAVNLSSSGLFFAFRHLDATERRYKAILSPAFYAENNAYSDTIFVVFVGVFVPGFFADPARKVYMAYSVGAYRSDDFPAGLFCFMVSPRPFSG